MDTASVSAESLATPAACSQRFVHVPASVLQMLRGFQRLRLPPSVHRTIRQLGRGQTDDKRNNVCGFFVLADAGAVLFFKDHKAACRWSNDKNLVNTETAPSLTFVDSGNAHVSLLLPTYDHS